MPVIDATPLPQGIAPGDTGHIDHHDQLHAAFDTDIFANSVNVMHPDYGAEDGGDPGLNTDAINLAVADIAATGKPGMVLIPMGVNLPVIPDQIEGATDVWFGGGGTVSTTQTTLGVLISFPDGTSNAGVRRLRFESPNNQIVAVECLHTDHVTVTGCFAYGPRLWVGGTGVYAGNSAANATTNAVITDNLIVAAIGINPEAAIWAYYVRSGIIARNVIIGHAQGIVGWGGDANADGALVNERKSNNVTINANIVQDALGGGIWFSMVEGYTVTANTVTGSADVGIDFEGSLNCSASGNTCNDNVGGNFTTFFMNRGISFTANTGTWSVAGVMVRVQNGSGFATNQDVTFTANTFRCASGIALVTIEPTAAFTWSWNTCVNVRFDSRFNNQGVIRIEGGSFRFDVIAGAAFNAINLGQNHFIGRVTIKGVTVHSAVTQPVGSKGIASYQDDPTADVRQWIEGNEIEGFVTAIETAWAGTNASFTLRMFLRNNTVDVGATVSHSDAGAGTPATIVDFGNFHADGTVV